jgi:hypothetical protein
VEQVRSLFYRTDGRGLAEANLSERYRWQMWRPSLHSLYPEGLALDRLKFGVRFFVHGFHLYSNRDYGALVIRDKDRVVHYSITSGRYWKTRFMGPDDIRIGHVWTDPHHRGERLGLFAITKIADVLGRPGRNFWYVIPEDNLGAVRTAETVGMVCFAHGRWVRPLGLRLMSFYQIGTVLKNPN